MSKPLVNLARNDEAGSSLVLSSHKRIVIASEAWFNSIGKIDLAKQTIDIGINRIGEKALAWFLDARGQFFPLEWRGKLPKSLLERIALARRRERYTIGAPRQVTAGEMLDLIADHGEQFDEAPNTADLRRELLAVASSTNLGPEFMGHYLGKH
jgi:hypothetical protein